MFPGCWCPTRIGGADLRHCFRNAAQVRLWTAFRGFVCEICARSERLVSALCRAEAGRAATFPISFRLNFHDLPEQLFATRQTTNRRKHALIRSGLADAGSGNTNVQGNLVADPRLNRSRISVSRTVPPPCWGVWHSCRIIP